MPTEEHGPPRRYCGASPDPQTLCGFSQVHQGLRDDHQALNQLLRGKQPTFVWEAKHKVAYEFVRDALLAGIHLAAPNFDLPFHLQTDVSEDGKGAVLYQLPSCAIEDQYPYCKKLHAPDLMAIITHFSKAFTEAQRLRPPFYLEADSLLWATDKAKFYG